MDRLKKILSDNPRFQRFQKPLQAAKVCEATRALAESRYSTISYRHGLLTLGVPSAAEAANLHLESEDLKAAINRKLSSEMVKRIRIKII